MKTKTVISILLIVIFEIFNFTCNISDFKTEFYDSGQLKRKLENLDDNCFVDTYYYKNGNVKSTGKICDSSKTGVWEEYYSDGELRWTGISAGSFKIEQFESNGDIIWFVNNPDSLFLGNTYKMRIKVPEAYLSNIITSSNNGKIETSNNKDEYDFQVTPSHIGELTITVYISYEGEILKIGSKSFFIL